MFGFKLDANSLWVKVACVCDPPCFLALKSTWRYLISIACTLNPCGSLRDAKGFTYLLRLDETQWGRDTTDELGIRTG